MRKLVSVFLIMLLALLLVNACATLNLKKMEVQAIGQTLQVPKWVPTFDEWIGRSQCLAKSPDGSLHFHIWMAPNPDKTEQQIIIASLYEEATRSTTPIAIALSEASKEGPPVTKYCVDKQFMKTGIPSLIFQETDKLPDMAEVQLVLDLIVNKKV